MQGQAWKFGKNINTDLIIPARYLSSSDLTELAKHCMEDADPQFVSKIKKGDIIVADENFGCGSSREHAPSCIKAAGISCVIAKSFARIFYRNAINVGLPILESPEAVDNTDAGDLLEVDLATGKIYNKSKEMIFTAQPFPPFIRAIIDAGGLTKYIQKRVRERV